MQDMEPNLALVSHGNPCTCRMTYHKNATCSSTISIDQEKKHTGKEKVRPTKEMAKGVAASVENKGGVLVVLLRRPHDLGLRRQRKPGRGRRLSSAATAMVGGRRRIGFHGLVCGELRLPHLPGEFGRRWKTIDGAKLFPFADLRYAMD